jgi:hypothetical protein
MLYHDFQMYSDRIPRVQLPGGASLMDKIQPAVATTTPGQPKP